jgi:hypothetical protein
MLFVELCLDLPDVRPAAPSPPEFGNVFAKPIG